MRRPWYFVLPEERSQPSGGNIYNERIIHSLQQAGQTVEIISASDYQRAIHQDRAGVYWVDTLVLESIQEVLLLHPSRSRSLLIVHHLESLSPPAGQSAEEIRAKEQPYLNWFQGFLATSYFTKDYLRQQGVSQPIVVAEPGTDIATQDISSPNIENIRALMVANLVERKGILPWLQWLAKNIQGNHQFSLTIVGRLDIEPTYAQKCISIVKDHSSLRKHVYLVGSQPFDQMANFYQKSNLFISTASVETFGMALQEARMHQLPILTLEGGNSAFHLTPTQTRSGETGSRLTGSRQTGHVFSDINELGSFFLDIIRKPEEFAILYQRTQQHPASYLSWEQAARELVQQFDQFFNYAP